nr:MAG TPA: hypothetical protein [Caudoviricetes sp.]
MPIDYFGSDRKYTYYWYASGNSILLINRSKI